MTEENNTQQENHSQKHNVEVSDELYQAIQQLKQVLQQMTGKEIQSDEEVIGILVSGFIESITQQQQGGQDQQGGQQSGDNSQIIT